MNKLPVSVISPVWNCIDDMPAHAEHLRELSRVAAEIIVVDSHSSDGTMDYLKDKLGDAGVVFLNHPPGLYPSWNHGISHATQPYLTMATVGDPLPPHSLERLFATLESGSADVVVSAPVLLNPDGGPASNRWPVHRLIEACGLVRPQEVSQAAWLALTLGFFPKSPLSSSAGNLYRTAALRDHPWPVDCGHRGDVIWAIANARKFRWMVDPTVESYFKFNHPAPTRKRPAPGIIAEWFRAVMQALEDGCPFMEQGGVPEWFLTELPGMLRDSCRAQEIKSEYAIVRRRPLPWFLDPKAIRLRKERRHLKHRMIAMDQLLVRYMKSLDSRGGGLL